MASMQAERVFEQLSHYQEQEKIQTIGSSACGCQEKLTVKEQQQSADREVVKEHKGCAEVIKEVVAKANEVLHEAMEHKESAQLVAGKKHDVQSVQQQQFCAEESNHAASLQGSTPVRKENDAFGCHNGEQQKLHEVVQKKQDGSCCKTSQHQVEDRTHDQHESHHKEHSGGMVGPVQIKKSEIKCKDDHQAEKYKDKKVISEKKESKKTVCELKEENNVHKELKCNSKAEKKEKKKKKEKVSKKKSESKDSSSSSSDSSSESEGECRKEKKKKNDKKHC